MDMTRDAPADAEPLLRQVVEQLCSLVLASRPELSTSLGGLRQASRDTPSAKALQEVIAVLMRLNGTGPQPTRRALDSREARLIGAVLKTLVIPTSLEPLAQSLERALAETTDDAGIERLSEQLLHLLTESRAHAERRQAELQEFLKATVGRLVQLESALGEAQTLSQRAGSDAEQGRQVAELQVVQLRAVTMQTEDIDELRSFVGERLDHLQEHLRQQDSAGGNYQARLEAQLGMLSQQVAALNAETITLRTRLDVTTEEALRDPLTGAFNRLAYDRRAALEVARWRSDGGNLSMIVCDIDHFKRINDGFGHAAGDKVLKEVARVLQDQLRSSDFVARYGGEEFVVLLNGAGQEAALQIAEKLRRSVKAAPFRSRGERVPVTISCGVGTFGGDDTLDVVFERTDAALYAAKAAGRDQSVHGTAST
jgi:diguanylate cyclase